jgi:hypothetical protein
MNFLAKNGWKQTGTAWMDNDEVWDVSVKRANMSAMTSLECTVTRRE